MASKDAGQAGSRDQSPVDRCLAILGPRESQQHCMGGRTREAARAPGFCGGADSGRGDGAGRECLGGGAGA